MITDLSLNASQFQELLEQKKKEAERQKAIRDKAAKLEAEREERERAERIKVRRRVCHHKDTPPWLSSYKSFRRLPFRFLCGGVY